MIPVGAGAVPDDAADLRARAARSIGEALRLAPETVVVGAEMSSADVVDRLDVDLSGSAIDERHLAPGARPWDPPASAGGTPATVRLLTITGRPVLFFGAQVMVSAEVVDVPAAWARDAAERVWLAIRDDTSPLGPTAGRVLVEGQVQAMAQAVVRAATEVARQRGLGVRDVRVVPSSPGRNRVRVDVEATVTKAFLKSRVAATVAIEVDADLVLHVRGLDAAVSGFLGPMAKPVIDRRLGPWRKREIPLRDEAFAGAHLTSLAVDVDPVGAFRVAATLG